MISDSSGVSRSLFFLGGIAPIFLGDYQPDRGLSTKTLGDFEPDHFLNRGFGPTRIYTNYVQPNPAGGSRWIVQSQPTRTGKIPRNPTTGRWWIVQVQPARSTTENRGRD